MAHPTLVHVLNMARTNVVKVLLSDSEFELVKKAAGSESASGFIRRMVVGGMEAVQVGYHERARVVAKEVLEAEEVLPKLGKPQKSKTCKHGIVIGKVCLTHACGGYARENS